MVRWIGLLLAVALISGCSSSSGDQAAVAGADYTLSAGDKVKFVVAGEKDFSGQFTIDSTGAIAVPVIGSIQAAGLSLDQLASTYSAKLRDGQILRDPQVSAELVDLPPVYVLGEVKRPGQYAYVAGMTLKTAVDLAEGYGYYAKESSVEITRGGRTVEIDADTQIKILPGDTIRIPKRFF